MRAVRRSGGFTLIEVLVVVFIIGVVIGMATLSLGGRSADDKLQQEARRLEQVLTLAAEEAIINAVEIGFRPAEAGYEFVVLGEEAWIPYPDQNTPFRRYQFAMPAQLEMSQLPPGSSPDKPAFLLLSSGELTPFEMILKSSATKTRYVFRGQLNGLIETALEGASDEF